jgi:hypothetical protein
MARINIPSQIFQGFITLSELSSSQVELLTSYIVKLPVDIEYTDVANKLNEILNIQNGKLLLQTFLSFSKLSEDNDGKNEKLATNLVDSFIQLSGEKLAIKKKQALKVNLQAVLNNYSGIKSIIAVRKILIGNDNNLEAFNINSDVRLVFNEDSEEKKRTGIIFHRMNIEYSKDDNVKNICFSLDIDDLKKLKIEIEKSIKNDQLIRDDYKEMLNFIF